MKMRFLLATTSVLVMAGAVPAGAEKIGIGVLDPQATLHVTGDSSSDSDVIIENLDAYDGAADNEGVLLIDTDDGHRMKTVPLTDLIGSSTDTTVSNTGASFDGGTNVLTISDETGDVTVDLSALSDTDTTIPSPWYGTDDDLPATDNTEDMYASGSIIIGQGDARSDLTINDTDGSDLAGFVITTELVETNPSAKYFAWASNLGGRDRATAAGQSSTGSEVRMLVDEIWDDVYFRALHSAGRQIDVSANSVATRLAMTDDAANTANIYAEDGFIGINAADPLTPLKVNALPQDNAAPRVVVSDALGNFSYADATVFTSASNDTTVSNTGAAFDGATNVLTISDETGDVTVDLSGLSDTDTALGTDDQTLTANRTIFTDGNELRISGASPELVLATDDAASQSPELIFVNPGQTSFDQVVLAARDNEAFSIDTETSGTLSQLMALAPTGRLTLDNYGVGSFPGDEAADSYLTVNADGRVREVSAPSFIDTTVSNTAAVLDGATNVLTISDETGDVTVDLSALSDTDTDTTDLDWVVSGSASTLSTAVSDSIYTNGNVGINTTTPSHPLVVDTAAVNNALVVRESTDATPLARVGVGTDTPGYSMDVVGDIRATNNIYAGNQFLASSFFQTSDARLKSDVRGYNQGLEVLRKMRTVSFNYNGMGLPSNTERTHYGVIAQELQAIDPALVGSFESPEDGVEYLTVNVQSMTYVLANAVQQLDAENATLRAKLDDAEARLQALEAFALAVESSLGVSVQ